MFSIECIDHIVLKTHQMNKMIAFYCDVLGCHIEKEQPEVGLTQLRAGSNLIDLVETKELIEQNNANLDHFCLRLKPFDFESLKQHLQQHKVKINRYGERYGAQGMGFSFYINDPEGNEVECRGSKT